LKRYSYQFGAAMCYQCVSAGSYRIELVSNSIKRTNRQTDRHPGIEFGAF